MTEEIKKKKLSIGILLLIFFASVLPAMTIFVSIFGERITLTLWNIALATFIFDVILYLAYKIITLEPIKRIFKLISDRIGRVMLNPRTDRFFHTLGKVLVGLFVLLFVIGIIANIGSIIIFILLGIGIIALLIFLIPIILPFVIWAFIVALFLKLVLFFLRLL